ncbi:MAG TPA: Fe-S cluster assembly protein SufD [Myxococcota bacterium]|nr:Fe-S cluster assembly protein SufD [Myxococcota bacterium]
MAAADAAVRAWTVEGGAPAGVDVFPLAEALRACPEALREALVTLGDDATGTPANPFLDLNAASFDEVVVVRVREGAIVEAPLALRVGAGAPGTAVHPRVLVLAGARSQLTLVETYTGGGDDASLLNAATELQLAEGAVVKHVRVQEHGVGTFHLATLAARVARDATYDSHVVSLGGRLARLDLCVVLDGPGASCSLDGLYVGAGTQHLDHHTFVDHRTPHGTSVQKYKGIVTGAARTVFDGRVKVRRGAQKTSAHQENRNLLLSDEALAHTKPSLEIDADDVKCSHGATVGQLDEDALFYLRARGIDLALARAMLTEGFAREIFDRLPLEPLRARLAAQALERL